MASVMGRLYFGVLDRIPTASRSLGPRVRFWATWQAHRRASDGFDDFRGRSAERRGISDVTPNRQATDIKISPEIGRGNEGSAPPRYQP